MIQEQIAAEKKAALEKAEADRIATEKLEQEKRERAAQARAAVEKANKAAEERLVAERKAAQERTIAEKKAAEERARVEKKAAEEKAIADKKAAEEKAAAEKKAAEEKVIAERLAAQERVIAEKKAVEEKLIAEKKAAEEKAAAEKERIAAEKVAADKAEKDRIDAQNAEQDRAAAQKAEIERIEAEKARQVVNGAKNGQHQEPEDDGFPPLPDDVEPLVSSPKKQRAFQPEETEINSSHFSSGSDDEPQAFSDEEILTFSSRVPQQKLQLEIGDGPDVLQFFPSDGISSPRDEANLPKNETMTKDPHGDGENNNHQQPQKIVKKKRQIDISSLDITEQEIMESLTWILDIDDLTSFYLLMRGMFLPYPTICSPF